MKKTAYGSCRFVRNDTMKSSCFGETSAPYTGFAEHSNIGTDNEHRANYEYYEIADVLGCLHPQISKYW